MNILYLHSGRMPRRNGSSVQVNYQCAGFAELGCDITLVAPILTDDMTAYHEGYNTEATYKVHNLKRADGIANGYRWALKAALWAVQQDDISLVYTRDMATAFFCTLLGLPTAFEAHQDLSPYSKLNRWMLRYAVKRPNFRWLVGISGALGQYYQTTLNLPAEKVIVAHDAAPPVDAKTVKRVKEVKRIGFMGNLYPGKGIETLVPLAAKHPKLEFHVLGGTPEQVAQWQPKATDNITWHGHIPHKQAFKTVETFDVALAPFSQSVRGGTGGDLARWFSPLKLFEYMAHGKAILCADLPVLREVVADGDDVMMCVPDDIDDWSAKLSSLIKAPAEADKLAQTARKHYEQRHTYRHRAATILSRMDGS